MANIKGLASIVSELRVERTNLANQLRHVDAALTVLGKMNGGTSYTRPGRTLSAAARKRISIRTEKAMGEGSEWIEASGGNCFGSCQAHHVGVSPPKDRSGTKGAVGKGEGGEKVRMC